MTQQKTRREAAAGKTGQAPRISTERLAPSIPNSSFGLGASSGGDLAEAMSARMERFRAHQIPIAEQEADQLGALAKGAATPAEVKYRLGQELGADFSSVRFHTGPDAVDAAGSMGAKAYTVGRDVYFGAGGFDPVVAAHELVHTVQQGAVAGEGVSVAAPAGQVQMKPEDPFAEAIKQNIRFAQTQAKELKGESRQAKTELKRAVRGGRRTEREAKKLAKETDKMLADTDKKPGRLSRFASAVKGKVKKLFGRSSATQEPTPEELAELEAELNGTAAPQSGLSAADQAFLNQELNGTAAPQSGLSVADQALLDQELNASSQQAAAAPVDQAWQDKLDEMEAMELARQLPDVPKTPVMPTVSAAPAAKAKTRRTRQRVLAQ